MQIVPWIGAGIETDDSGPLVRSASRRSLRLSEQQMSRRDALRMVKRRVKAAGLSQRINCHSFRATEITAYLEYGGTIEKAKAIAAHESPRTTKLYNRTNDELTLDEVDRILIQSFEKRSRKWVSSAACRAIN